MTDTPASRTRQHEHVRLSLVDGSYVEGDVDTGAAVRLSDTLNDRPPHLEIHCPTPDGGTRLVFVRKSAVVLVLSDEPAPTSDMRVPKHRSLLLVGAGPAVTVAGNAHLVEGADPAAWLHNYANRFMPLTEAQVKFRAADGEEVVQRSPFALLGLDHATTLTFEEERPAWAAEAPTPD